MMMHSNSVGITRHIEDKLNLITPYIKIEHYLNVKNESGPLSSLLLSIVLEVLTTEVREEDEIQIGKEVKLSLFADNMMLYTENPKDASRR